MITQRITVPYSVPECECHEGWPQGPLCSSPSEGESEDVGYEDWDI